jgi:hypothetical protein
MMVAHPLVAIPILSAIFLIGLAASDFGRTQVPPGAQGNRVTFRLGVTLLHLAQPVARAWGRARNRSHARRNAIPVRALGGQIQSLGRGIFLMPEKRPRPEVAENLVQLLRRSGLQVVPPTGWEAYDALVLGSALVGARLVTSSHPPGWLQLRIQRYLRWKTALMVAAAIIGAVVVDPRLALAMGALTTANIAWGLWRTGPGLRRALVRGSA